MTEVYKIKLEMTDTDKVEWVQGFNGQPKTGGTGKIFTNKKLADKMFEKCQKANIYDSYRCKILTYQLIEVKSS